MNGADLDRLAFRHRLMQVSEQLESDDVRTLKSLFTRKLTAKKRHTVTEGYELFAALEEKGELTTDEYSGVLRDLFETLGRDPELCVAEFEKGLAESRKALSAVPHICTLTRDSPEDLYEAYSQCLVHLGDNLAREDGSLQKVVYMCPQLPLKYLEAIQDGHALFRKLEEKGLIRCWCLSYLYVCFLAAERIDLCNEVEQHSELAKQILFQSSAPECVNGGRFPSLSLKWPWRRPLISSEQPISVEDVQDSPHPAGKGSLSGASASRVTVFDHRLYCWMEAALSSKVIFGILAFAILLSCLLSVVNYPIDKAFCNGYTATHNLLARLTVCGTIPSYVIWRISRTITRSKLKSCKLLNRAWNEEYCKVFERIITSLSTNNEDNDLEGKSTVEKVNTILTRKLVSVTVTSVVQSAVSAIGFFLLHAASWYTFAGLTDTVTRCFCLIMILAYFATNALVGAVLTLYLFEMRVREYLLYVIHYSGKKVRPLCDDARELKKVLDERWWEMNIAWKIPSFFYLALLASSLYFQAPFFCAGGKTISFTEDDLQDLPRYWLFWVIISFVGYIFAYSYWTFIYGRIVAIVTLIVDILFVLLMRVGSSSYPKWAGLTHIVVVLCPLAAHLSTHYIACVHIWLQTHFRLKSPGQKSQAILPVFQLAVRKPLFVLNFVMCLSLVTLSVCTLVKEYQSLTTFSNSTAF